MKGFVISTALLLALAVFAFLGGYIWWQSASKPVSSDETTQSFIIPKGATASAIGTKLVEQGLAKNALAFKFYVQLTGNADEIKAGQFTLAPNLSLVQLVAKLTKGPIGVWVTIPEGLRREELADIYIAAFGLTGTDADEFRAQLNSLTANSEGKLFPDTYLFPREATPGLVVNKMLDTFNAKVDEKMLADIRSSGYSLEEILTLASIIERETITNDERPVVAGILYNRLRIGMALQTDATVQYFLGTARCRAVVGECEWWQPPLRGDLTLASPYNTYTNVGLPPAPIASPGISSIKAAVYPADTPYFYYLHDKDGGIHYATTLEQHNSNVTNYIGK